MRAETLGQRIARLRREQGIKQYRLAKDTGLHPSSLNQIEKGKREPQTATLTALAHRLGVSRDMLVDGDAKQSKSKPQILSGVMFDSDAEIAEARQLLHDLFFKIGRLIDALDRAQRRQS